MEELSIKCYENLMENMDRLFVSNSFIRVEKDMTMENLIQIGENVSDEIIEFYLKHEEVLGENVLLYEKIVEAITTKTTLAHLSFLI